MAKKQNPTLPEDIFKIIVELSTTLSSREIAEKLDLEYDYRISHSTVARYLRECRSERAEIFKAKYTEEIAESLPKDLELLNNIIQDLYIDYQTLNTDKVLTKCKIAKTIAGVMTVKFSNMGSNEQNEKMTWEDFLKANPTEEYVY